MKHVFYFGGFVGNGRRGMKKATTTFKSVYRLDNSYNNEDPKGWIKLDNQFEAKYAPVKVSENFYWRNNWAKIDTTQLHPKSKLQCCPLNLLLLSV